MGMATLQRYLEKSNEKLNIKSVIFKNFVHHLPKKTIFQRFLMMLVFHLLTEDFSCLLYTSPSPRDGLLSRMPSSA